MHTVTVTGNCPSLLDYHRVLLNAKIVVDDAVVRTLEEVRSVYLKEAGRRRVYGFSTGVGALQTSSRTFSEETLILEHAAGVGKLLEPDLARLVVFVRIVQLTRGGSPVRPAVVERLVDLLNHGILPAIPAYGSVGASGDLAPLAHLALVLLGKGKAYYRGKLVDALDALRAEGLKPLSLEKGEALSLINGTAFSTALTIYALMRLASLVTLWVEVAGTSIGLATFNPEHYAEKVFTVKRHPLPDSLVKSFVTAVSSVNHPNKGRRLQDPYSLRCFVQALQTFCRVWRHVAEVALCEACSPSDNPVVAGGSVLHQCSFHGATIAAAADYLLVATAILANNAERRIAQLLERVDEHPFLGDERSPHGLMIAHYTAAALTAKLRHLASPCTVHSIPTSGMQEDYVSMSSLSAVKLLEAVDLLEWITAIEALTAARLALLTGSKLKGWMSQLLSAAERVGVEPVSNLIATARRTVGERLSAIGLPDWAADVTCS